MAFDDLRDFLDEGLDLPIGGVTYHVAPPTAAVGLRLQLLRDVVSMAEAGIELKPEDQRLLTIPDAKEIDFYRDNLGPAYDEMLKACTATEVRIAAGAAFLCWTSEGDGRTDAETYWKAQMDPRSAATSQMTTPPIRAGRGSTVMAAASGTKPRNSGSGTSSPRSTNSKASKKA